MNGLKHGRKKSGTQSTKRMTGLDERNYRPITLLRTVDKVFESMMSIQVNNHFDSKLDPCIPAYGKKHSCETTLLRLTEDWKLAVDSEQFIGILSTDMSKAFDSLHPSLRRMAFQRNHLAR